MAARGQGAFGLPLPRPSFSGRRQCPKTSTGKKVERCTRRGLPRPPQLRLCPPPATRPAASLRSSILLSKCPRRPVASSTPGRGSRLLGQLLPEQPVSTPGTSSKNSVQTLFRCSIFLGSGCRIPLMGGHGTTAPLSHVANTGKGHSGTEPVTDRGRCGAQG